MLVRKPVFRPGASGDMSSVGSATNNGFAVSVLVFTFVPNNNGGIVVVPELVRGAETLLPHSFPVPGELTRRAVSQKVQHYRSPIPSQVKSSGTCITVHAIVYWLL